jgi:hypothetical protein
MSSLYEQNDEECEKYIKRCDVMIKLITNEFKNDKLEFTTNPDSLHVVVVVNDNNRITLLPNISWNEIRRNINNAILQITKKCIVCYETIKKTNICCPKCSNSICGDCYINEFRICKGLITCPHCKFTIGQRLPESMIEKCVDEIKQKLNNNNNCECGDC